MKRLAAALVFAYASSLANASIARADYAGGLLAYEEGQFGIAFNEFRTLARTGHSGAEFMLGVMYFNGLGVPRNATVAAIYFHQAAVQGEPGAQLAFGSLHIRGIGVLQDLVEARTWLGICSRGHEPDLARQAKSLMNATQSLMTPAEITLADRRAERWRPVRPGLVRGGR